MPSEPSEPGTNGASSSSGPSSNTSSAASPFSVMSPGWKSTRWATARHRRGAAQEVLEVHAEVLELLLLGVEP